MTMRKERKGWIWEISQRENQHYVSLSKGEKEKGVQFEWLGRREVGEMESNIYANDLFGTSWTWSVID